MPGATGSYLIFAFWPPYNALLYAYIIFEAREEDHQSILGYPGAGA